MTNMRAIMIPLSYGSQTSNRQAGRRLHMRNLVPLLPWKRVFVRHRFFPKTPAT
jgi:hypothetical protein